MSVTPAHCARCKKTTQHEHKHDCAHGIPETHMVGSERFVCVECGWSIHASDDVGPNAHLKFILDKKE